MPSDDSIKNVKDGIAIVGEIIKVAGDNPNVKKAGNNLGETALTITKTINNVLLPLAAINFAFDKARKYFSEKFQQDLSEKTSEIPPDQIVEPKASIAGPTLQGIAFTHEEPCLKDMFLSLLATAMDARVSPEAHPAFVEIIKQLTSDEAELLCSILKSEVVLPIVQIRLKEKDGSGWRSLATHILNIINKDTKEPTENPRCPAMVDNWIRLGLVEVDYSKYIQDEKSYAWVEKRPEVLKYKEQNETEDRKIDFGKGVIVKTALGSQFSKAVGII